MRLVLGLLLLLSVYYFSQVLQSAIPTSPVDTATITKSHSPTLKQVASRMTTDSVTVIQNSNSLPLHVVKALYYLYLQVKEQPKASNKGKYIDDWNRIFGLSKVPWCATSQSSWNKDGKVLAPIIKSAMAKSFATKKSYGINDIMFDRYVPKAGDYRVKSRRGGNHVDLFIAWNKADTSGYVIGGNVGDQVGIRKVTIKSMVADGTAHITSVKGCYDYYLPDNDFKEWLKQFGTVRQKVTIIKQRKFIDTLIIPATVYDLHGYKTASGVRFDRTKLTAAHKTLPLGTKAIVEYKGKRTQILINDRCPKKGIIDFSKAVCDSLKFRSGNVKLYIIGK